MLPTWDDGFPDPTRLRHEVMSMAQSYVEVLLELIPHSAVQGIYLKGSANKRWDSPIDYVPDISDVDLHIDFYHDDAWRAHFGTVAQAIEVQRRVESRYISKVKEPVHTPRPQLIVVNKVMAELDDFVPSPPSTVNTLYGLEYPAAEYSAPEAIRRGDSVRLVENSDYLTEFPMHLIDKPGKYTWNALRALILRVSPAGPRVLHISGIETERAWGMNRTEVLSALNEVGYSELARHYAEFYLAG